MGFYSGPVKEGAPGWLKRWPGWLVDFGVLLTLFGFGVFMAWLGGSL